MHHIYVVMIEREENISIGAWVSRLQALKQPRGWAFAFKVAGSRQRQPFEHKRHVTPFEVWSRSQSGHRGGGKILSTKTHSSECGFVLKVGIKATEAPQI